MRIRLDPWPVDTMDGQLTLKIYDGQAPTDIETTRWAAVPQRSIPDHLRRVLVVDGKPRMEARLLLEDDHGGMALGGYGAFVVGAVDLCPHGSRPAELHSVRASRMLAHSGDFDLDIARLSPRNPHTGQLEYHPVRFEEARLEGAKAALQRAMLEREGTMARELATAIADPDDEPLLEELATLVLQDGPVRVGLAGSAIVGCVKTLHTDYLGVDRSGLLASLKPGERTPILRFGYESGGVERQARFTWYVRLCDAPFYLHPFAGVMRLEMHAPDDPDFLPAIVQDIADLSGELLCKLGSAPHKDPRAPQNLIPTAALEQAMSRAMGSQALVTRRIRAHVARELGLIESDGLQVSA